MEDQVIQLKSKLLQSWQEIENLKLELREAYSEKSLATSQLDECQNKSSGLQESIKSTENRVKAWMKIAQESQQENQQIQQQFYEERDQLKSQTQTWMNVALEAQEEVKQLKLQLHQKAS